MNFTLPRDLPFLEDLTSKSAILEKTSTETILVSTKLFTQPYKELDAVTTFESTTASSARSHHAYRFPFPILMIVFVWMILGAAYFVSRWRQRAKSSYIIPRVFVLCSPRTVQFHYELILRVGLPSYDFNPDKHDIDLSVQGHQKNEVVPVTRMNTRTLMDEPLITNLSLVVYRLVEMPPLGGLVLKHSGPFKAWVYAYDFTVIDLATNKEHYYTLNQYIGSLNRVIPLDAHANMNSVNYPIDDVPLPQWTLEDIFLLLYTMVNCIMLVVTMMPINCSFLNDIFAVLLTAFGGGCLVFFLDWLLYYHLRWNQERREYFNESDSCRCWPNERITRVVIGLAATIIGLACINFVMPIDDLKNSIVWLLVVVNSCTLVIGLWNIARNLEMGETIVSLGLKLRGTEMISVGMHYSDMLSDIRTKSGSSDDGGSNISNISSGRIGGSKGVNRPNIDIRSSLKSFGFDPVGGRKLLSNLNHSGISSTGATPNNQPGSQLGRPTISSSVSSKRPHNKSGHHLSTHSSSSGRKVVIQSPPKNPQSNIQS